METNRNISNTEQLLSPKTSENTSSPNASTMEEYDAITVASQLKQQQNTSPKQLQLFIAYNLNTLAKFSSSLFLFYL